MLQAMVNASFKASKVCSFHCGKEKAGEKRKKENIVARRGQAAIIVKTKPHKAIKGGDFHREYRVCVWAK